MTWAKTWFVVLFFTILVDAGAAADDATTRATLEVQAEHECTTRADLVGRVQARSPRIQFVDDATLTVEAKFKTVRPDKVVGEVVLHLGGRKRASRRVLARSCADAADAVALIIAVALDPTSVDDGRAKVNAVPAPESGSANSANASTASTPSRSPTKASPARPVEQPAASSKTEAPDTAKSEEASSYSPPIAVRSRFGAHLAGKIVFGPAPGVMPGLALYAVAGLDRDALWSPAIIVGANFIWRDGLVKPGGTASFALYAASFDACPFRVSVLEVEARACASSLFGLLAAAGSDTNAPASSERPFAAAGAVLVFTAGLGSVIEAWARLGMGMTLVRDSFEFGSTIFYRVSPITASASLGIGARLP